MTTLVNIKISTVDRPYVLTFHGSGHSYPMTAADAQRLCDTQCVHTATANRIVFHGHNSTKPYDRATLRAATAGGGPAFVVTR